MGREGGRGYHIVVRKTIQSSEVFCVSRTVIDMCT